MKKFWDFKNAEEGGGALYLYGEISDTSWFGDEVTPSQFRRELDALGDINTLDVYINSPGGDVFAGMTIYNILKRHEAQKTVHIDGLAASAASYVAMAGDKIVMPSNATLMIHNAMCMAWGNKHDFEKQIEELDRIDNQIADIYVARTCKEKEDILALMDAETWMSGDEALEMGFVDDIAEAKQIAACADCEKYFNKYKNAPQIKEPTNGGESQPVEDITPETADTVIASDDEAQDEAIKAQSRRFALNNRKNIILKG